MTGFGEAGSFHPLVKQWLEAHIPAIYQRPEPILQKLKGVLLWIT